MRIPGMRGRRLESAEKAKKELGLTFLVELPPPTKGAARLAAAYTHLLQETLLRVSQGETQRATIAVTSTREHEGRSSVAANLAIAAARSGRSVLLVDTEVRNPQLHLIFEGDESRGAPGLVDLLAGAVGSPSEVLLDTGVPGVRLLPIGTVEIHNAAELFSSPRLERFIRSIAPRLADLVIFDTPHIRSNEPGRHVLTHVDGVLFTVGLGETESSAARKALEILARNQVSVLGGVYLALGDYPLSMAVPLPEVTLQNLEGETEILGRIVPLTVGEPINIMPEASPLGGSEATENEVGGMSMNVATAQKKDDDSSVVPAGGFGVEDLEAVLQGWRRRDGAVAETAEVEEVSTFPIALPPDFSNSVETAAKEEAVAGVPIAIPFLSVETRQDSDEQDEKSETKLPLSDRPILTLVDDEKQKEIVAHEEQEDKSEEPVSTNENESHFMPVIPVFPVPVKAAEAPPLVVDSLPVSVPVFESAEAATEPIAEVAEPEAPTWPVVVAPAPIVAPTPSPIVVPSATPVAVPVVASVVTAPSVANEFFPAPAFPVPPTFAPAPAAPVAAAPGASSAPLANRMTLDMQIDMFQTGPGEMTMRAVASNASAVGYPPISLEVGMAMSAMRGMRAITPSSAGGSDQPRIALEAVSTDAPDATRMRMVVGSAHEPALEVVVHNGTGISVRTGTGHEQPAVKLDSQNLPDGGTLTRATLLPARGGQELVLELRREPVNDGFTDARWRNRLSLFA